MRKLNILFLVIVFLFSGFYFGDQAKASSTIVNPNQTYTYSEMVRDIGKLQKAYPDLIKVKVIGKSEYGRNIYAFSLGKGEATVFINGSHHAREWLTTNLNMYMAENYAKAYKNKQKIKGYDARKILDSTTIWFVPMVNPDGVTLQQSGLKAFPKKYHASLIKMNEGSKNFTRWKANGKGVDLNRQYDANWKQITGPSSPRYKNYKGKAPHTAAETKVILKFVDEINPEMSVSYHSTGKILYWKFKQDKARYARDHAYAKKIGSLTGYRLMYPSNTSGGGGFTDWFVDKKKRPAFTPEISKPYYERNPPLSEFKGAWKENQAVGLYVAQESVKLFDARYKKKVDALVKDYKSLNSSAKKLKDYYYTNVKSVEQLRTSKGFLDLYNKVNKEFKSLESSSKKLPKKYQSKFAGYSKNIKYYLTKSNYFITGLKSGESLVSQNAQLVNRLEDGMLDDETVKLHEQVGKAVPNTKKAIANMYGVYVRKFSGEKFVKPVENNLKEAQNVFDRNNLLLEIEKLVHEANTDLAKEKLTQLEQLEQNSSQIYQKLEEILSLKKQAVLEKFPNSATSQQESSNIVDEGSQN